ncbi:sigma-70 family RNA polymerase sigma factor [Roseiflexus castenholzii]|uniref:sigma-70 family RNA polymerase sigma factor n=1 Tax=Roseiflexus castenholzii TaxID=120962 RepID=UPI003C7BF969
MTQTMIQLTLRLEGGDDSPSFDEVADGRGLPLDVERMLGARIAYGRMASDALQRRSLPPRERRRLEAAVEAGKRAMMRLVLGNRALAVSAARRSRHGRESLQDAIQDALIGLIKAAMHFRSDRQAPFATYAMYWIRHELRRAPSLHASMRIPAYVHELTIHPLLDDPSLNDEAAANRIQAVLRAAPTASAHRYAPRFTADRVRALRAARAPSVSIHQLSEDGGERALRDSRASVEDDALQRIESEAIHAALQRLSPQEREAVVRRFWSDQTIPDIAHAMHIAPLMVRSLLNTALRRLRDTPEIQSIREPR